MRVLADSQPATLLVGIVSADASAGLYVEVTGGEIILRAVSQTAGVEEVFDAWSTPTGDWTLTFTIAPDGVLRADDSRGHSLVESLSPARLAEFTTKPLYPYGGVISAARLAVGGTPGAVVDLAQWAYSLGADNEVAGMIATGGTQMGVVR